MKMKLICLIAVIIIVAPMLAFAQVPFGGVVTFTWACNTGLMLTVWQATGPIQLMWLWGELPFLSYVIPHPGQEVLGMAAITPIPCVLGYVPVGYGLPIIYHGSGL